MRITSPALSTQLKQGIAPLYLLFGPETLLIEEALDQIRGQCTQAGYSERIRLTAETGFDWNRLQHESSTLSLFADKRLIELRLPTGKPGEAGSKALVNFAQKLAPDTTLIVVTHAIDKRSQTTKWFKAIQDNGLVIECPAIGSANLPGWISRRMSAQGLKHEPGAAEHLSQLVEGNLLAAAQEINLLGLLYPDQTITPPIIEQTNADHARFNVYVFVDACLGGTIERTIRILQNLKHEQAEPIIILWALARDVRTLCQLSAAIDQGERPGGSLFKRHGIWSSRSALVSSALNRLPKSRWENILQRIGHADLMVKGRISFRRKDIWEEIESISLAICGL